jgi:hypothetical protein
MLSSGMIRPICLWLPTLTVFALSACGGSENDFFGDRGHAGRAGASSHAGSSSSSGASNSGGAGGWSSAGAVAVAGSSSSAGDVGSGGQGEAGDNNGGAPSAGASSGGRAGASSGGAAGSGHAGASGGGATAGHGGIQGGSAGSGGTNQEPSCSDLLKQASEQLDAARACNLAANSLQCTGTVKNTCNCQVPVQRSESAETKAYLNTLKKLDEKNCVAVCTAQACKLVSDAECKTSGSGSTGVCTAVSGGPGPGSF